MSVVGEARPGGRTARTARAVFAAAVSELASRPYGDITIESIATRAGVHRTTVHRRWGTVDEVIAQALAGAASDEVQMVDTGTFAGDLHAMTASVAAVLASPAGGAVLRVMLLGAPTHPRLQAMAEAFWRQRVAASDAVVHRAVDRGELPAGTDARAVVRSAVAPLYFDVLVLGRAPDERTVRLCVDATLAAIAAGTFGAGAP